MKLLHLCGTKVIYGFLQKYGEIIEAEIIYNERGSKVIVYKTLCTFQCLGYNPEFDGQFVKKMMK